MHPDSITIFIQKSMLNEKIKRVLKIALPALFITYACCITFFTHTHIVNGVTIVHSHPYATDEQGNPSHEHTGVEIQLIHTLSTFFVAGLIVWAVVLGLFRTKQSTFYVKPSLLIPSLSIEGLSRLRPPPAL